MVMVGNVFRSHISHGDKWQRLHDSGNQLGISFSLRVLPSQHPRHPWHLHFSRVRLAVWVQGIHTAWALDGGDGGDVFLRMKC